MVKKNRAGEVESIFITEEGLTKQYSFITLKSTDIPTLQTDGSFFSITCTMFEEIYEIYLDRRTEADERKILKFCPKTRYTIFDKDFILEGYSLRNKADLCEFLQREQPFVLLDRDGEPSALISQSTKLKSSFTFETIKQDELR